MLEKALVNEVLGYLTSQGHYAWRNNSGFFKHDYTTKAGIKKRSVTRAGIRGSADIIGCSSDGRFIAIECKVGKNKLSPHQEEFVREVVARGGIMVVAYSLQDVKKFI